MDLTSIALENTVTRLAVIGSTFADCCFAIAACW